ncbi:MAG: surface-adhesin E family protein [Syntrophales bacterium]
MWAQNRVLSEVWQANKGEIQFMKLTSLSHFVIFFTGASLLAANPIYAQTGKEQWIFVGFTKYRDALYIDEKSISYPSPDIARVWSLVAPSKRSKYRQEVKSELKKLKKSAKGLKYAEILNEIECRGNRIRFMQIFYFNAEGSIIHSAASADQEWKIIYPGSLWQNMQSAACKN